MIDFIDDIKVHAYNNLLAQAQIPGFAGHTQAEFNAWRLQLVKRALQSRPFFLTLDNVLPAAATNTPIPATTKGVKFPLIIKGAISNGEDRNIRIYMNDKRLSLIGYGRDSNLRLSQAAVSGGTVAVGGYVGVQEWPSPVALDELDYLTQEMFQETNPGAPQVVSTVFPSIRNFQPGFSDAQLSPQMEQLVKQWISMRPVPLTTWDVVKVEFDAGTGFSPRIQTPQNDGPYLILGFRVNNLGMGQSTISFGYDDLRGFSSDPIPIWGVAAEYNDPLHPFRPLPSGPLFMDPNRTLLMQFFNSIDGTTLATDGNLEILKISV